MNQEPHKSNLVLIVIAIIGVIGTVIGAIITVIGNYNVEKFRQETELTKVALVSIATQGGATQMVLQSKINAPTDLPAPTYTPYPTQTLYPTSAIPTSLPATLTPMGMTNQVVQVTGKTALGQPFQTGIYIQAGDLVQINYVSGQWYIGQNINGNWTSQTPTDANGYTGRDGDRVASLVLDRGRTDPNRCRPLLSAPFGSLIGRISETGGLFYIGNSNEFTAQDSGVLYLLINYWDHNKVIDCPYGDGGEISVRVNITPQ